jgi:hypothetical protein
LNYLLNAGDAIATGGVVVTWTNVAPVNLLLGKGVAAKTKFSPAISTFTVAPARLMDLGFGHLLEGAAASGQLYSMFGHDFYGLLMLPPGTVVSFCSTITTSMTFWTTIVWAEIPVPNVLL